MIIVAVMRTLNAHLTATLAVLAFETESVEKRRSLNRQ
jgi:hypothetical protein